MKKVIIALLVLASLFAFVSCKDASDEVVETEVTDLVTLTVEKAKWISSNSTTTAWKEKYSSESICVEGVAFEPTDGIYIVGVGDFEGDLEITTEMDEKKTTLEKGDDADGFVLEVKPVIAEGVEVVSYRWFYTDPATGELTIQRDGNHPNGVWKYSEDNRIYTWKIAKEEIYKGGDGITTIMLEVTAKVGDETKKGLYSVDFQYFASKDLN